MDSQERNSVTLPSKTAELRRLAGQGETVAMQYLLAQTLAHKQIQVQLRLRGNQLEIWLRAAMLPNLQICLKLLSRELLRWSLPPQQALWIAARQNYRNAPIGWQRELTVAELQTLAWGERMSMAAHSRRNSKPATPPTPAVAAQSAKTGRSSSLATQSQGFNGQTWKALAALPFLMLLLISADCGHGAWVRAMICRGLSLPECERICLP